MFQLIVSARVLLSNQYRNFPAQFMTRLCDLHKSNRFNINSLEKNGNFNCCNLKKVSFNFESTLNDYFYKFLFRVDYWLRIGTLI